MLYHSENNVDDLLDSLKSHIAGNDQEKALKAVDSLRAGFFQTKVFRFKDGNRNYAIPVCSIRYIKAEGGLVFIYCDDNKDYVINDSLKSILSSHKELLSVKRGLATTKSAIESLYFNSDKKRWDIEIRGFDESTSVSRNSIQAIRSVFDEK